MNDIERMQNQLLVTLAQAVLVMHQTQYVPTRLREQLARQVGELEALTEGYAGARSNVLILERSRDDPIPPKAAG